MGDSTGVWNLCADVLEHTVSSIFIGGVSEEERWHIKSGPPGESHKIKITSFHLLSRYSWLSNCVDWCLSFLRSPEILRILHNRVHSCVHNNPPLILPSAKWTKFTPSKTPREVLYHAVCFMVKHVFVAHNQSWRTSLFRLFASTLFSMLTATARVSSIGSLRTRLAVLTQSLLTWNIV